MYFWEIFRGISFLQCCCFSHQFVLLFLHHRHGHNDGLKVNRTSAEIWKAKWYEPTEYKIGSVASHCDLFSIFLLPSMQMCACVCVCVCMKSECVFSLFCRLRLPNTDNCIKKAYWMLWSRICASNTYQLTRKQLNVLPKIVRVSKTKASDLRSNRASIYIYIGIPAIENNWIKPAIIQRHTCNVSISKYGNSQNAKCQMPNYVNIYIEYRWVHQLDRFFIYFGINWRGCLQTFELNARTLTERTNWTQLFSPFQPYKSHGHGKGKCLCAAFLIRIWHSWKTINSITHCILYRYSLQRSQRMRSHFVCTYKHCNCEKFLCRSTGLKRYGRIMKSIREKWKKKNERKKATLRQSIVYRLWSQHVRILVSHSFSQFGPLQ